MSEKVTIPKKLAEDIDSLPDKKQTGTIKKTLVKGVNIHYEVYFNDLDKTLYIPQEYILS